MRDIEAQLIHDMRNTVTVIQNGAAQLHADHDTMPSSTSRRLAEMLSRRTELLARLLDDLTAVHQIDRGSLALQLTRVDLPTLCSSLVADRGLGASRSVRLDLDPDAVAVADPARLSQVVENLITNALRYGGPDVEVAARRDGDWIRLSVSDDGDGVPEELSSSLFRSYARGPQSAAHGGSGLGLAISWRLCERMNGRIEHSRIEGRTVFTCTLPAVPVSHLAGFYDVAPLGHTVAFWDEEQRFVDHVLPYAVAGLTAGEAVVIAATPAHLMSIRFALRGVGIDAEILVERGQLILLDADDVHRDLPRSGRIDPEQFDTVIGSIVRDAATQWERLRAFGEIVDLYWRRGDGELALQLENCWNALRETVDFPLLCAYQLADGEEAGRLCDCHDAVVAA